MPEEKTVFVPKNPDSDQVNRVLVQVIREMNRQHYEDRKKIEQLQTDLDKLTESVNFLVGAKRKKLQHSKDYRDRKRTKGIQQFFKT